jgi:hypothetical protein
MGALEEAQALLVPQLVSTPRILPRTLEPVAVAVVEARGTAEPAQVRAVTVQRVVADL